MKNSGSKPPRFGSSFAKKPRPSSAPAKRDGGTVYVRDDAPRLSQARSEVSPNSQRNKKLGEAVIERFGHDGRGITQLNGKTTFVTGALAGERVTLRLVNEQPRFIEARVDQVLDASVDRQAPPCPHFTLCGGCQLQHIQPDTQLLIKQQAVIDQVKRWGGVSPKHLAAPVTVGDGGYRARARLGVWYEDSGEISLGFRQKGDKKIVSITQCYVLQPKLSELILPLQALLKQFYRQKSITHIELIHANNDTVVIFRHIKPMNTSQETLLSEFAQAHQVSLLLEPNGGVGLTSINGAPIEHNLTYSLVDQDINLEFQPQDFTQVNPALNNKMLDRVFELLDLQTGDHVVDLFCGMGNVTLPIAKRVKSVIGVEGMQAMVSRAMTNASNNGINNAEFLTANLASENSPKIRQLCAKADIIVLDPPRDGAREIVAQLRDLKKRGQLSARKILYISCNPATLARDTALLVEGGFTLDSLGVLDMFPHTQHVESIALFNA